MSKDLEIRGVTKRYGAGPSSVLAIDDITLVVREGEFVSIIGPSGCGKSTLFNAIGGMLDDYEGEIRVAGDRVAGTHKDIGIVFQEESTFPWRTVMENVALPLELAGVPRVERKSQAQHYIDLVGLSGAENRYPAELSGGMRQRTAIARTLAFRPKVLLMDEPFGALDEQTRLLLGDRVLGIHRMLKQTTLLITHNITEAVHLSDRVIVMSYRPGRVLRTIDIDLPYPRSSSNIADAAFGRYVGDIWTLLRDEASRGMAEGERAVTGVPTPVLTNGHS